MVSIDNNKQRFYGPFQINFFYSFLLFLILETFEDMEAFTKHEEL